MVSTMLLIIAMTTFSQATVVNLTVADDRTITADGSGNASGLGPQNDGFLRTFGVSSVFRSVIEFDMSGVAPGSTINLATLGLRDEGTSSDGRIDIFGFSGDGVVSVSDALETSNLVTSINITSANGIEDFSRELTSFVQGLVTNNALFAGLLLVSEDETSFSVGGSDICSSEAGNGTASFARSDCVGFGPSLTVDFATSVVPLPAALPLYGTGLAIMGFVGWRRKRKAVAA